MLPLLILIKSTLENSSKSLKLIPLGLLSLKITYFLLFFQPIAYLVNIKAYIKSLAKTRSQIDEVITYPFFSWSSQTIRETTHCYKATNEDKLFHISIWEVVVDDITIERLW